MLRFEKMRSKLEFMQVNVRSRLTKYTDVLGLSRVSRKWRDTFSSVGVCRMMIQKVGRDSS